MCILIHYNSIFFFFNDTATTEIYTLSLHDALPIYLRSQLTTFHDVPPSSERHREPWSAVWISAYTRLESEGAMVTSILPTDRKSTRLNSSHGYISYAVFCLKKKKTHRCS